MTFSISGHHYYPSAALRADRRGERRRRHPHRRCRRGPTDDLSGYAAFGGDGVARWGDYSAAVAAEDGTIWTASEWIPGTFGFPPFLANWGTFIGNVSP